MARFGPPTTTRKSSSSEDEEIGPDFRVLNLSYCSALFRRTRFRIATRHLPVSALYLQATCCNAAGNNNPNHCCLQWIVAPQHEAFGNNPIVNFKMVSQAARSASPAGLYIAGRIFFWATSQYVLSKANPDWIRHLFF
jgi:hypothetical protein